MKKLLPLLVIGILVLSGLGVAAVNNNGMTVANHPPNKPDINGPAKGIVGTSYEFVFCTTDPDGDDVSYFIEWRDGTSTGWTLYFESGEEVSFAHTWSKIDHYIFRCKAKDIYGAESDWGILEVTTPRNKMLQNSLFLRSLDRYPLIQGLLDILGRYKNGEKKFFNE